MASEPVLVGVDFTADALRVLLTDEQGHRVADGAHAAQLVADAETRAAFIAELLALRGRVLRDGDSNPIAGALLRTDDGIELDIWVDDRIVLEATGNQSHQNVMKGGAPSQSREAEAGEEAEGRPEAEESVCRSARRPAVAGTRCHGGSGRAGRQRIVPQRNPKFGLRGGHPWGVPANEASEFHR